MALTNILPSRNVLPSNNAASGWNFRGETNINNAYSNNSAYQGAYQQLWQKLVDLGSDSEGARQSIAGQLSGVADQFKSLWANMVGRAPTEDEVNTFLLNHGSNVITESAARTGKNQADPTDIRNQIAQYVGDNGKKAAEDYAATQLQGQKDEANRLAGLFRTQGNQAISDTENSLLDYQSRLFERLRPNLMTSLQAQGLLDTGGLNEALAGKQADLANEAANYVAQLKLQNENQANQIAFGGESAPYYFQQANITNQPAYMQQQAQNAMGINNSTFMSNLDYTHQLGLLAQQNKYAQESQPSFLRTFGQSAATSLGSNFNIPSWIKAAQPAPGAGF